METGKKEVKTPEQAAAEVAERLLQREKTEGKAAGERQNGRRLRAGCRVGIVCCSDGLGPGQMAQTEVLCRKLKDMGLDPAVSPYLARRDTIASASARERAGILMEYYRDPDICAVFDVSGGNLANQVLEYLDFSVIRDSGKELWGYSDLTVLLNGILARTGNSGWLYQMRNLAGECQEEQERRFRSWLAGEETAILPDSWKFLQGREMEGILAGGNIRCLLKLAGTDYFPELEGKVLFLESLNGGVGVVASLLTQLGQMKVFEKISGLLLGTFTEMEEKQLRPRVEQLVLEAAGNPRLPVAYTRQAGHGADSRALHMGTFFHLSDPMEA